MKKSFVVFSFLFILILSSGVTLSAQDEVIPTLVQANFNNMYSEILDVYWEEDGDDYLASFSQDGYAVDATFRKDGVWQQSITTLELEDLPETAQALLKKDFGEETYYSISKIEIPEKIQFSVNLETEKQFVNLLFDTSGKLLDKQVEDL